MASGVAGGLVVPVAGLAGLKAPVGALAGAGAGKGVATTAGGDGIGALRGPVPFRRVRTFSTPLMRTTACSSRASYLRAVMPSAVEPSRTQRFFFEALS